MAAGMLTLNGQEAEATFGMIVTDFSGDLSAPARTINLLTLPGLPGGLDPGLAPVEAPRVFTVHFMVQATSDATVHATLDKIKEVCGTGLVELRTTYSATRALYGVLQPFEASGFRPWVPGWVAGSMSFLCPQPYWVATMHSTIAFGATPVGIPLGTAPSTGRDAWSAIISIVGAAVAPTLSYCNGSGDVVSTMAFTNTIALGDQQVIDVGRRQVWRVTAGTWTNGMGDLTAGYAFPALAPSDGWVATALWPSLKVSTGSASIRLFTHSR